MLMLKHAANYAEIYVNGNTPLPYNEGGRNHSYPLRKNIVQFHLEWNTEQQLPPFQTAQKAWQFSIKKSFVPWFLLLSA